MFFRAISAIFVRLDFTKDISVAISFSDGLDSRKWQFTFFFKSPFQLGVVPLSYSFGLPILIAGVA